jgi:hypothetical protein
MAEIDLTPILAHVSTEVLVAELARRMGVAAQGGDTGQPTTTSVPGNGNREPGVAGQVRPDEFFRLSIPEAVKKYLAIMKRPQGPKVIVAGLEAGGVLSNAKNFYGNVYKELMRMSERGELVNTPSGWALSEWYPNKPKQIDAPRPKKRKASGSRSSRKKVVPSPKLLTDGSTPSGSDWQVFLADARKRGKSMREAGAEWKARSAKD